MSVVAKLDIPIKVVTLGRQCYVEKCCTETDILVAYSLTLHKEHGLSDFIADHRIKSL
jgi:hypothetical protein